MATRTSGGTEHLLPMERAKASFDPSQLTLLVHGDGHKQRKEWARMFEDDPMFDFEGDHHLDREAMVLKGAERSVRALQLLKSNPDALDAHMTAYLGQGGIGFPVGSQIQSTPSSLGNHYGIFVGALLARGSEEQQKRWLRRAINMKILGAYAQTEVGHGSNVRGLLTTATFDKSTQEFVIDTPVLTASKWWPGCFGLLATHCVVYARLILDGVDHGVKEFMVVLRGPDHKPLPGVEVGDLGAKSGYNAVDSGYAIFSGVRIPRFNMLSRYEVVTPDGELEKVAGAVKKTKGAAGAKLQHIVMITTRISMVYGAFFNLAKASTIAIRYSAVRLQGFKNTRKDSLASGERQVLDYQVQQYRLFKALSMAFAFNFVAREIRAQLAAFRKGLEAGDVSALPELHATAAGLKAFTTNIAGDLMEDLRRCCGGHGTSLSSGIAGMSADFNAISPIAEGDATVLILQTARFLVRSVQASRKGGAVAGQAAYLSGGALPLPAFEDLRNLNALVAAFQWRARESVEAATSAFEASSTTLPFDEAWNANAVALHKAAHDHTFYVMASRFAATVGGVEDLALRTVLHRLALHFVLTHVREHAGDWAAVLVADGVARINHEVVTLLAELRPDAVALVDSFDFPDRALRSALGRHDGKVYEALHDFVRGSPLNKPSFAAKLFKDTLSKVLDAGFIAEEAGRQRAGPSRSKL